MMKKHISLILLASMAVTLFTGCREPPDATAELQKDVQYGTLTVTADVDGAWVYINGEEYGVAPMQVNLPYGSYNVMLEKSGYQSYKQSIQISSQTAAIHATME